MHEDGGGLRAFADELNPAVVADIRGWRTHDELHRLRAALESHTSRKPFFDSYAEALVARHLLARGCGLRFEIATPQGRRCDFEAACGGSRFYLHLKRLDTDRPPHNPRAILRMSSRLRVLQRIARPYVVQVRWIDGLRDEQMQSLVTQASEFITAARVGDEMRAHDQRGREIGGVRVIAPGTGPHVEVTIGLPTGFLDQAPRFRRLMHRAYQQFMPRAANVIVICSHHDSDVSDFETALLGSHIERWDAFPPPGRRVAHGRAADGFWHGQRFSESRFAGWFRLDPAAPGIQPRLWVRQNLPVDEALRQHLERLLSDSGR